MSLPFLVVVKYFESDILALQQQTTYVNQFVSDTQLNEGKMLVSKINMI